MDNEINAAYLLVDYAYAVLMANDAGTWDRSKYDGLIPIVSSGEAPEFEEFSGPHIVYGYAEDTTSRNYAESNGSITFVVYDERFRRLGKTLNILKTAFEREDDTAKDVNNFTSNYDPSGNGDFPYLGIRFGSISIGFAEGGLPESEEGGRQSGIVNVKYQYYTEYDVITSV